MTKEHFKAIMEESQKRVKKNNDEVVKISKNFEATIKKLSMII